MRIAIVTESFPPDVNGVAHSVVRAAEHLVRRGHTPIVIAPAPSSTIRGAADDHPYPVIRVPSVAVPRYRSFRLGLPSGRLADALNQHAPDVVHLASPFVLGARGMTVAGQLDLPTLAVYQTDLAAYARHYRLGWGEAAAWRWLRNIHNAADRTLAPSTRSAADLVAHGVQRVWLWRRGVDSVRFDPALRDEATRRELAPNGELLVGYVGRLAVEKRVELLAATSRLPGVRLVIIGDGPARRDLEKALPGAVFLGSQQGADLARLYASLDIFVHSGPYETFGQTVQEALASGLPVVAPAAGGPLDLVEPGVTGTLVPPEDGAALAEAVADLAGDPERRQAYGIAARVGISGRSWAAVGDELIGHYRAVLTGAASTSRRIAA
ncbi:glycosyltransferase family 4 protein [Micromonospora sp. NPDC050397]|uniref:glycosyltransferase family 4 protein n=1 Tax=Micromonospora sp. NPDC050397 TaxID=3364279 RepID=UPI0038505077